MRGNQRARQSDSLRGPHRGRQASHTTIRNKQLALGAEPGEALSCKRGRTGFDLKCEARPACRGWFVGLVKNRTKQNKRRLRRSRSRGLIDRDACWSGRRRQRAGLLRVRPQSLWLSKPLRIWNKLRLPNNFHHPVTLLRKITRS